LSAPLVDCSRLWILLDQQTYTDALADAQPWKRRADGIDAETELLEANRRRLLAQDDWIGVAPSQPLHLNFPSGNEKFQIGKRRRVKGKHGATARHREQADNDSATLLQPAHDRHNRAFVSGALGTHTRDIRIRIGTDALTTACSTEPVRSVQSRASSDPMLFDQLGHQAESLGVQDAADSNLSGHHPLNQLRTDRHNTTDRKEDWIYEQPQRYYSPPRIVRGPASQNSPELCRQETQQTYHESIKGDPTAHAMTNRDVTSELRFVQQVEGVGRHPLRLAFTPSESPVGDRSRDTVRNIDSRGTTHVIDAAHASDSQNGLLHHIGVEPEFRFESEAEETVASADEEPWRLLVDVPEESSTHRRSSQDPEKSFLQLRSTPRSRDAERTSWSQHATQGDQTHISSSVISASLPSLRRPTTGGLNAGLKSLRNNHTASPILNEDEQLWRNVVFGSDQQLSSQTMHTRQEGNGQTTWRGSSGYLPLSAAVSSIRRSPFSPTSVQAYCSRGEGVHDAAMFAPRSGSIDSPDATHTGAAEEFSDEKRDAELAVRRSSVTHANNAPGNTNLTFWRTPCGTEMLRGLEHTDMDRDSLLERGTGRDLKPSSAYETTIPASDDEGLDLVDANKMF
jgi:hypothetical protein